MVFHLIEKPQFFKSIMSKITSFREFLPALEGSPKVSRKRQMLNSCWWLRSSVDRATACIYLYREQVIRSVSQGKICERGCVHICEQGTGTHRE